MFRKIRKNLKFILKIEYDDEGDAIINKLAPILNQLSMEETSNLDDFLYAHFTEQYQTQLENEDLTSTLFYTIWRGANLFHQIKIKPLISYEFYFKYYKNIFKEYSYYKNFIQFENTKNFKLRIFSFFFFNISIMEATTWTSDISYNFSHSKFVSSISSFLGIQKSYSKREEMLGRTINFRRKIQKKKFEEY